MASSAKNDPEVQNREEEENAPAADDEDTGAQIAPIVKLEEVAVSTGEEDEDPILDLYEIVEILYRFYRSIVILKGSIAVVYTSLFTELCRRRRNRSSSTQLARKRRCKYLQLIAMPGLRCVIVAVDGSEESMTALRWVLDNIQFRTPAPDSAETSGSLVLLHVQSPPSIATTLNPGGIPFGGPTAEELEVPAFTQAIEAPQKRITKAIFDHALEICAGKDVNLRTEVLIGDPKEKICEAVDNLNADFLVMGSRAFGPIKRMFLGSVSNYCLNNAQCPVFIAKNKDNSS